MFSNEKLMINCIKSFMMISSIILNDVYEFSFNILKFTQTVVIHCLSQNDLK